MIVLGIETSCDETSVSIVEKEKKNNFGKVLSERTLSQISKHKKFGGVVPELASREHSKNLDFIVKETLKSSKISLKKIDAFAATTGPGLLGALLVGTNYAKALAISSKKPFVYPLKPPIQAPLSFHSSSTLNSIPSKSIWVLPLLYPSGE